MLYFTKTHFYIKNKIITFLPPGRIWALTHWQNYFTQEAALLDLLRGLSSNDPDLQGGSPWIPLKLREAAFLAKALLV